MSKLTEVRDIRPGTVKLATPGGHVTDLEWDEGATGADYLRRAEVNLTDSDSLSVNGEPANATDVIPDGSVLVVAPQIANG